MKKYRVLIGLMMILIMLLALSYYFSNIYAVDDGYFSSHIDREFESPNNDKSGFEIEPDAIKLPEFYKHDEQPLIGEEYTVLAGQ